MTRQHEYPRPDRDRSAAWLPLDGRWEFRPDEAAEATGPGELPAGPWPASIEVPFAWETAASGVRRTWLETAWYRTAVTVPEAWAGGHAFLCFGAVHHEAAVWVNGELLGRHTGGYTPFEFDLGAVVGERAEILVRVHAPADKREFPHGKQRSIPRDDYDGVGFTPTSGIWQPVWLERRPATYVDAVELRGDSLTGIDATVTAAGPLAAGAAVTLHTEGVVAELTCDASGVARGRLALDRPRPWSPADPHLYRVDVTLRTADGADTLAAHTGLRRIEADGDRLRLNGERLYVRGVLDQGYWPGTGLTAPGVEALREDLRLAAAAGYNLVRKHLKFEDPRWLHEADRAGMLVWAEPASTSRFTDAACAAFEEQLAAMVRRDGNHPSIVVWGLYNEEWGLDWDVPGDERKQAAVRRAYDLLAALDRTRPIVDNSGWAHVRTDLVDWHHYEEDPATWARTVAALASGERTGFPVRLGPDHVEHKAIYADDTVPRTGVPFLNSEYGGGFTSLERGWQLRWQTQELRRHDRIAGYVYTELADVEHESAGLLNEDRSAKDLGGFDPAIVNAPTTLVFDVEPLAAGTDLAPGDAEFELPVRVSHHGSEPLRTTVRAAWTPAGSPRPGRDTKPDLESAPLTARPFVLSDPVLLRTALPDGRRTGRLWCWTGDDPADADAAGFVDVGYVEQGHPTEGRGR